MAMHIQEVVEGEMVGAAKYRKEYEQNIGLIERRMGLTVSGIVYTYVVARSSSTKKASLIGLCSG
eukprot:scaffold10560_cov272-Chaetoceros_neogracile.AAC.9